MPAASQSLDSAARARPAASGPARADGFPRTSVRVRAANPNHHLWNNNGTWYMHYTMHPTPLTKTRIRMSLETKDLETARLRRDEILSGARRPAKN
jgi:hypothetical protein